VARKFATTDLCKCTKGFSQQLSPPSTITRLVRGFVRTEPNGIAKCGQQAQTVVFLAVASIPGTFPVNNFAPLEKRFLLFETELAHRPVVFFIELSITTDLSAKSAVGKYPPYGLYPVVSGASLAVPPYHLWALGFLSPEIRTINKFKFRSLIFSCGIRTKTGPCSYHDIHE
jgi:hypothetical protein